MGTGDTLRALGTVQTVRGVDQYLITDRNGNILFHYMEHPENVANLVFSCGRSLSSLGKNKFRYTAFFRKNKKNLLIFSVAGYYLGVVKKNDVNNFDTVAAVMAFLKKVQA